MGDKIKEPVLDLQIGRNDQGKLKLNLDATLDDPDLLECAAIFKRMCKSELGFFTPE